MTGEPLTNNPEQQDNLQEEPKDFLEKQNDCVKELLEQYDATIKNMTFISDKQKSDILHDFVVAFLARTKSPEKSDDKEKPIDKYTYFMPETFLCWALFEYSYYNEKTVKFVIEALNKNESDLESEIRKCKNSKLIQTHYDAYKHSAGNMSKEICEHLKKLLSAR
ncbi:MAG: hypothetical protein FWG55_01715 [Candidatus Bathyarchaeota archaeon]|nr:hypothetical protein [Candidatus Termiticorpusculum sp.]